VLERFSKMQGLPYQVTVQETYHLFLQNYILKTVISVRKRPACQVKLLVNAKVETLAGVKPLTTAVFLSSRTFRKMKYLGISCPVVG